MMAVILRAAVLFAVSVKSVDASDTAALDDLLHQVQSNPAMAPSVLAQLNAICQDVTPEDTTGCYDDVLWAKETGINTNPEWYAGYPVLSTSNSFQAYQWVLADKVLNGQQITNGDDDPTCPPPCNFLPPACYDVNSSSPGLCYSDVKWAQTTGIIDHPDWYANFPTLNPSSSFNDYQYVLHTKLGPGNGTGWQCPMPCSSTFQTTTSTTPLVYYAPPTYYSSTTTLPDEESFPWWAWLLCALAVLFCCGLLVAGVLYFRGRQTIKQTRKRAVDQRALTPTQSEYTDNSSFVTNPSMASNVYTTSFQTSGYGAPIQPAQAVPVTMAQPAYGYAPQYGQMDRAQAAALFDQLDSNHDGTLSRAEFGRMMQAP